MRTIREAEFRTVKTVKLNKEGKSVGELAVWHGRLYYLTYRRDIHFMIKYQGFGINADVLRKIIEMENQVKHIQDKLEIVILYSGRRGKKFYKADPMQFLEYLDVPEDYGGKERGNDMEFYGKQWFLPVKNMELIGVGI